MGRATYRTGIQASLNGTDYTSLGVVTLAAQVNPPQIILLGLVPARFIRFDILENSGGLTYPTTINPVPTDSGFVGLAEVQFFGTAVPEPTSLCAFCSGRLSSCFCATGGGRIAARVSSTR